ncbi:slipin family protein [Candidatus Peregrinibacteria bacterium]|nr:slipin family protein [Candidatus Peregrinibacteria bacterium]
MEIFLIIVVVIVFFSFVRQVNQYERGIVLTMGKFSSMRGPGWTIILPIFQSMHKVDIRIKTVDVPEQEAITKDNIPAGINAVIYYKVSDPQKAILEVENFYYAVSQLAQITMRNVVGSVTLEELLRDRSSISEQIQKIVDEATDPWGIKVDDVDLKDIIIPADLKRTIAKVAEAERERKAAIIRAEGEVVAAESVAKAAHTMASSPGALHLRTLQSINDISSDQSNTTVWMMPLEVLRAVEAVGDALGKKK